MTDDTLVLGPRPDGLIVRLVADDPWTSALILLDADDAPRAWTAAPVLEFSATLTGDTDPLNLAATLSADAETSTANAMATWVLTEDQVNQLCAKSSTRVRLSLGGVTWYRGRIQCQR